MLIGKTTDGRVISLLNHSRERAEDLRGEKIYCPCCGSLLVLKNGSHMRPHFAHKSFSACASFSEGETEEHLSGKSLIADWCETSGISYELEAYLPDLQQRPDVLLEGKYAIEFQCSFLSPERMQERTKNYQRYGYQVFWLLGRRFFLRDKLANFHQLFLNRNPRLGFFLWELDVKAFTLRLIYHIERLVLLPDIFYSQKTWKKGQGSFLAHLNFPRTAKIFLQRPYDLLSFYQKQQQGIQKNLIAKNPLFLKEQERLYLMGTNFTALHPIFFLPPVGGNIREPSAVFWRVKCWLYLTEYGTVVYKNILRQLLAEKNRMHTANPLIEQEEWEEMIYTWLKVLVKFNYISIEKGHIRWLKQLDINVDERAREAFIEKMMRNKTYISRLPKQI